MKCIFVLLALLLSACQGVESQTQKTAEPAPERNDRMAGVVIWWAHGTEPFWKFTADADGVNFENMGEPMQDFPYRVFGAEDATRIFDAKNASTSIRIRMTHKTCINAMSGAEYAWTAEVVHAGKKLQGCGERGRLPE